MSLLISDVAKKDVTYKHIAINLPFNVDRFSIVHAKVQTASCSSMQVPER